ncbi:MAG TPA: DNA repair protein RecN [Burkholderiales bacterium]|nr:DNA repair protein RecN [Burkholderiales bacterium]
MLRSLAIRDFVIVDRLDLEFQAGFTALTGETGAGKSILIDALALVLGERSDAGLVRAGSARAEISAEFAIGERSDLARWLDAHDLADEPGICLLRRVLEASGRSRAYVNGRPCTLQQVKDIGERLVDIHGQHEHQSLLRPSSQRELLDAFAGAAPLASDVAAAWRGWQEIKRQRQEWERNADALAAERERLEFETRELGRLAFSTSEWEQLQAEHRRLANAASLIESVEYALEALSEGELAALAVVNGVLSRLNAALEHDAGLREALEILEPAQIQIQEAVYSLRHYRQRLELDPARLKQAEERLEAIHSMARRYRVAPERLSELLDQASSRLAQIGEGLDAKRLEQHEREAQESFLALAGKLSAQRQYAARELSDKVTQAMQALAMAGGRFEAALEALTDGGAHGLEQAEFRVAAHAGGPLRPLAKVASGGELSRLSLAVQSVTSELAQVPVLVFDEVDAGIGGRVAEIVGRMLRQLGKRHQVMCITHLPQVAAAADHQWQVVKREAKDGLVSSVQWLGREQRVEEIARMLGGVKISETTRKHAAEMLGLKT